jgi:hypothetical protein
MLFSWPVGESRFEEGDSFCCQGSRDFILFDVRGAQKRGAKRLLQFDFCEKVISVHILVNRQRCDAVEGPIGHSEHFSFLVFFFCRSLGLLMSFFKLTQCDHELARSRSWDVE